MENEYYPNVIFKVQIILCGENKGKEKFCLGLKDAHNFIDYEKRKVGLENYSGYRSQAVNLSTHTERVIRAGLASISV